MEVGVGTENVTGVFATESYDLVIEHVEREAPQFPFVV